MSFDFDYATYTDKEALIGLYDQSFPGEHEFALSYFEHLWEAHNTLVLRDKNRIVAAIHMLYLTLAVGDERYKASYLYMVGTLKDERGKGLMNNLMQISFLENEGSGCDLSSLIVQSPGLFDFYARFGYQKSFYLTQRPLHCTDIGPAELKNVKKAEYGDIARMQSIYDHALADRLYHKRTADDFKLMMALYDTYVLIDQSGAVCAYAFMRPDQPEVALESFGDGRDRLLCALAGQKKLTVFAPAQSFDAAAIGALRPLTERGTALLSAGFSLPPYMNLLYN